MFSSMTDAPADDALCMLMVTSTTRKSTKFHDLQKTCGYGLSQTVTQSLTLALSLLPRKSNFHGMWYIVKLLPRRKRKNTVIYFFRAKLLGAPLSSDSDEEPSVTLDYVVGASTKAVNTYFNCLTFPFKLVVTCVKWVWKSRWYP